MIKPQNNNFHKKTKNTVSEAMRMAHLRSDMEILLERGVNLAKKLAEDLEGSAFLEETSVGKDKEKSMKKSRDWIKELLKQDETSSSEEEYEEIEIPESFDNF